MRLTKKKGSRYLYNIEGAYFESTECLRKLGPLEDIMDEFEIDSIEDLRDRLTKYKFLANHEMSCVDANAYNLMLEDLNNYHSIEEELGIDLITYFRVKRQGYIYYKSLDGSIRESKVWGQFFGYDWCWFIRNPKKKDRKRVRIKHYGKTWALTKEELEK